MTISISAIFVVGFLYLSILFAIAFATDKKWIPERLVNHPVVFVLSLGVFASAWAYYGVLGLAHSYGFGFMFYYFGITAFFMLSPLLLKPLVSICKRNQLSSLADLLAFRFRSSWAGALVTLCMLMGMLPLLALQIQSIADTVHIMTDLTPLVHNDRPERHDSMALVFCFMITLFTILFGARHTASNERHDGLIAAVAAETVIKSIALVLVAYFSVQQVFGGFGGLDLWLDQNPQIIERLHSTFGEYSTRTLLLTSFAAAIGMPHMFHMIFSERPSSRSVNAASWGVPLLLLIISLPVLPILWAGYASGATTPPDYFAIGTSMIRENYWLTVIAYIGGLSAASGVIIVSTLALASMCLNHLILPYYQPPIERDIYRWLLWTKRLLIAMIILAGYIFFRIYTSKGQLGYLGVAGFAATLQFLPGIFAVLYTPKANRNGLIGGLLIGFGIWFFTLVVPIISSTQPWYAVLVGADLISDQSWIAATVGSLIANILVFVTLSWVTRISDEERSAAQNCALDSLNRPERRELTFTSSSEFKSRLASALGVSVAEREVNAALDDLGLKHSDNRPYSLRRLRERIEANLSSLLGASVAHEMINRLLPYKRSSQPFASEDIQLVETRLETYKKNLTGVAAELDGLRRLHKQTLLDLPIGVFSLGPDNEVLLWNYSIAKLTGISSDNIRGSTISSIDEPWRQVFVDFANSKELHLHKQSVELDGRIQHFSLHKASRQGAFHRNRDQLFVLEDLTELQMLEDELLHSERLASIGRLAAGVAHEIGNPVTGIACLAQNLRYESDQPGVLEVAEEIVNQTDRISSIVHSLVSFSHSGKHTGSNNKFERHNLSSIVDEACKLISLDTTHEYNVNVVNLCEEDHYVFGDEQTLVQVFINLLSNARDASPEDSDVLIESLQKGNNHLITVTDQGSGISADKQEKIFEPFFTTKEPGKGTGLGLALVYSIIEEHQGSISVKSPVDLSNNSGTQFLISLPQA
ncbi:Adaptive-response sensory-kinase SasA [Sinobacterium norvegicum]|uniref:histidine kinase n=1 Tax=Sinobacterium norvegicum TaxID=1641715 RepID=A0ABM9AGZ7_9GAMM|nr:ATP-binding protein [Sinobacterium norvegicum]CAH0992253.1 Adaptive-response sensory-kinase SasA [Sinobacterium norvegicum]